MNTHLPSPTNYREDINGLRAWAVLSVLFFHFKLIGLPGGFAGVDIFYVISGYLMTAIIVGGCEKGNFSIWKFYMSRIRRILPALLVLVSILFILGWFWLPTIDYQGLGKESAYSLTFLSNIGYWESAGYFDSAAEEKWLLHTWSLAVEAQFYVLYPLFLTLVWKLFKNIKVITIALFIIFLVSLVLSITITPLKPSAAFYLLPTRGWELAAGGLVYLISKQQLVPNLIKEKGYWLGWILIILSFTFITKELAWPGYWAILPVIGTSLIILGQKENCQLTDNGIAQWLGDRSYSLYLWHWPLVVALYITGLESEWSWVICAFILSILLGHLSYILIETQTRKYLTQTSLRKETIIIGVVTLIIGFTSVSVMTYNFEGRVEKKIEIVANESKNIQPRRDECHSPAKGSQGSPGCVFGDKQTVGVLIIGDSHAVSSVNPITIAANNHNYNSKLWSFSSCPTIKGIYKYNRENLCSESTDWILNNLTKQSYKHIVLINTLSYFKNKDLSGIGFNGKLGNATEARIKKAYINTVCNISKSGKVFLVRPYPIMNEHVPKTLSRNLLLKNNLDDIKVKRENYLKESQFFWNMQDEAATQCNIKILNPLPYLCDDQYCYGSKKGYPLYYDSNHLSEYGNKFLVPMFEEVFDD